jgi:polyhydroxyalkanoate synthase
MAERERLAANLMAVGGETQALAARLMGFHVGQPSNEGLDPYGAGAAIGRVASALAENPLAMMQAQIELMQAQVDAWRKVWLREIGQNADDPLDKDKRYADPEWRNNPFFDAARQSHAAGARWLTEMVERSGADPATRRKASFFLRQFAEATAPTNFLATNPVALRRMLESEGESLLKGLAQIKGDFERGDGRLSISQTDSSGFKLGENIATAPGSVVFRNRLIELIQYSPTTPQVYERPLVIFPPWINKFYILDLQPANSMIRWLVGQGYTVFVCAWRNADDVTAAMTFEDYVVEGIEAGVDAAREITGEPSVNVVGYCIGGTLMTATLALHASRGDTRINAATFFASQSDFSDPGELTVFTDDEAFAYIRARIEANNGLMPGEIMAEAFNYLRPQDLVWRYVVNNYLMGEAPPAFDLLHWNADQTNIPGPVHEFYLENYYRQNRFAKGELQLFGKRLDPRKVKIPMLFQAGREDHIAPPRSVYRGARLFGGPVRYVLAGSGHIAGVVNPPSANKYQHWFQDTALPEAFEDWLASAPETKGSWWPTWDAWLAPLSGAKVTARVPGEMAGHPVLGPAPGTYVRTTLADIHKTRASR